MTQREEYEAHAHCGLSYRELMSRHNRLIEWIENKPKKDK